MRMRCKWMLLILVLLSPAAAIGENPLKRGPINGTFKMPVTANFPLSVRGGAGDVERMLKGLLNEANPAEAAAEVLKLPPDKIETVPRVFWKERKWLDWAEKADIANNGEFPSAGPDGKVYLSADVTIDGGYEIQVQIGPERPNGLALSEVGERIATKMVRKAPEFSVAFEREQRYQDYDRIERRLRELNEQIEKLRQQIGEESGLPPAQLTERLADLAKQELSTRMSLDVMKAREDAIRQQIDIAKAQANAKVADNQTLRTLKRIVELRKSRYENLKQQKSQGVVPQADVDKGEEEMLAAMVEADRASAAQQKDASQAQLDQLSGELTKLAIDRAENEAQGVSFKRSGRNANGTR